MKCTKCNSEKPESEFRKYRRMNKSGVKVYTRSECKSCEYNTHCAWKQKNRGFHQLSCQKRKLLQTHSERMKKQRIYYKNRRKHDVQFKLVGLLRRRIHHALKGCSKSARAEQLLGCSINTCRQWIESQFQHGMTWDNIAIDHKMPCSSFDFRRPEEQMKCFHWSNLQPLTPSQNREKSNRIPENWVWKGHAWGTQ